MSAIELFHFLRPLWLLTIPVVCFIWWLTRRLAARSAVVEGLVAPHLREALTINRDSQQGLRPIDMVALIGTIIALAAAGPTWSREASPWFAETAPLVVALEVTDTMRASDIQPTRLERARFKLLDLIAARTGSRTAILAYSGSAHIVVPPSSDIDVIKPLLESLDPAVMPVQGANAAAVLPLASELLGDEATIGTILFVNDGFDATDVPALGEFASDPASPGLVALVVGTEEGGIARYPDGTPVSGSGGSLLDTALDAEMLDRVESVAGVPVVRLATDDSDIRQLLRNIESNLQQADDPNAQWVDRGSLLLWPACLLALLWFRRGWTMRW